MSETVGIFVIALLAALIFIAVGLYSLLRKTPMHFVAGTKVDSEKISNVKAYNRANGIMWMVYGLLFIISGSLAFYNITVAGIVLGVWATVGIPILVVVYYLIRKKYKHTSRAQ